jgi:hypothetical protein
VTKTFSTHTLLSTATGLALPSVGRPEPWDRAREALIAQHPAFANVDGDTLTSACEGKSNDERNSIAQTWADNQTSLLGATEFAIVRGAGRNHDVMQHDAMVKLLALNKPALVVTVDGGAS